MAFLWMKSFVFWLKFHLEVCSQGSKWKLGQLERLRSEMSCPMITHTSDSHHIPSQNKSKF